MRELREMIQSQGVGMSGGIVRVDGFLNHRVNTGLLTRMGYAFFDEFHTKKVDLILTVESGGIPIAMTTAQAFGDLPVVYAKKGEPANMNASFYESRLYSYTHGKEATIRVSREYLPRGANVLIVDDFLANGEAARALIQIVKQAEAHVTGVGVCVEKAFQSGGASLRSAGFKVVALATIAGIRNGKVILQEP